MCRLYNLTLPRPPNDTWWEQHSHLIYPRERGPLSKAFIEVRSAPVVLGVIESCYFGVMPGVLLHVAALVHCALLQCAMMPAAEVHAAALPAAEVHACCCAACA